MHVCPAGKQQLDDIGVRLRNSPHQRRLAARAARIGVRALREQASTAAVFPDRDATISGVSPETSAALGLAPASSKRFTSAALPFVLAAHSGVTPRSFAAFTFAPARIS